MYDVILIGAGIIGCATARQLSRYNLSILVLEKEIEVSMGSSKANSGIVHAGYDCKPGTKKAKLNVEGNRMYTKISADLEIPFKRNGSLVLAFDEKEFSDLSTLLAQGRQNGVQRLSLLTRDEVRSIEPGISDTVYGALHAADAGIISPYEATVAFAENACENGVSFLFETTVQHINKNKNDNTFTVDTNQGTFTAKAIINAAGVHSDTICRMLGETKHHITPRKGEYCLFDKMPEDFIRSTIFQIPSKFGKGILVTPTVHGNLLVGPSADEVLDKNDLTTSAETLQRVLQIGGRSTALPTRDIITSFAGLRASHNVQSGGYDFCIEQDEKNPGAFYAVGIDSPGLSAAPAIAKELSEMVIDYLKPAANPNFIETRKRIPCFSELTVQEQSELIRQNPAYGKVVCRCELVTEAEIVSAITRHVGARTTDGIKRRTRAGMGRCQAGFCTTKLLSILSETLQIPITEVTKSGGNSYYIALGGSGND